MLLVLNLATLGFGKQVTEEFKVVPNKAGQIEVALDTPPIKSSSCRFEWDSSGATVEVSFMNIPCFELNECAQNRPYYMLSKINWLTDFFLLNFHRLAMGCEGRR